MSPAAVALFAALGALAGVLVLVLSPVLAKNAVFVAGIPFAAAFVLVMFLNFEWMMWTVLMTRALLDPVLNLTKFKGGAGMGGLLNLLVIVLVGTLALRFPGRLFRDNPLVLRWAAFLALAALSVTYSPLPSASFKLMLNLATYLCMSLMPFLLVRERADERRWVKVLLWSTALPVLFADLGFAARLRAFHYEDRLMGTFTHPNILGFYLVFVVAIAFYAAKTGVLRGGWVSRALLGAYLANVVLLLLATKTRGAWISCWTLFFVYGLLRERKYLFWCVLLPALLLAAPQVQERLKDLKQGTGAMETQRLNSMAWRMKLWEDSMPEIRKAPALGHGLGTFEYRSKDFFSLDKRGAPAHNIYVEILFELGALGLLAYLAIFWGVLKEQWRRLRSRAPLAPTRAAIVLAYALSYAIVGYSDNMLYYLSFNWYFWFFIGLASRSLRLPDDGEAAA